MIENLSKLADDIVLADQDERKLFHAYKKKLESPKRRKAFVRKYYRAATVAFAMVIMLLTISFLQSPDLVIYAASGDEMVKLKVNEKVNLEKQQTFLGYGYVLEISVKDGKYYYSVESEDNLNTDNIFRDGNKIIWIPDGMNSNNFRDQDGNVIEIPETDNSTLNIEVYNDDKKIVEKVTLILEREGEQCSVELLKNKNGGRI